MDGNFNFPGQSVAHWKALNTKVFEEIDNALKEKKDLDKSIAENIQYHVKTNSLFHFGHKSRTFLGQLLLGELHEFVKVERSDDPHEGFFGILSYEILPGHQKDFDAFGTPTLKSTECAEYTAKTTTARKTVMATYNQLHIKESFDPVTGAIRGMCYGMKNKSPAQLKKMMQATPNPLLILADTALQSEKDALMEKKKRERQEEEDELLAAKRHASLCWKNAHLSQMHTKHTVAQAKLAYSKVLTLEQKHGQPK